MNYSLLSKTLREHLNTIHGINSYVDIVYERTLRINDHSNLNGYRLFIGCTFVFEKPPTTPLKLLAVCGCTFVYFGEKTELTLVEYDYGYYIRNLPGSLSCYGQNTISRKNVAFRICCLKGICEITDAAAETKKHKQETNESKLQFSYQGKDFSFSSRTFSAGVELEIPVRSDSVRVSKLNRRRWLNTTDCSQITGDLEMVSYPANLGFYKSSNFCKQVQALYNAVEAPVNKSLYVNYDSSRGSGIHVHISWHKQHNLNASEVREFYYKELEKRGGQPFCLEAGGKSFSQFQEYSPYLANHESSQKYDCVNVVNERHVELRWLANDPDPSVVCARISLAIDIFESAVLELYRHKIATSTRLKLWTIQPHFKLLPKATAPQTTPAS